MDINWLKNEYEKRIIKIEKWNNIKSPHYLKTYKIILASLSFFITGIIICLADIYKKDVNMQVISIALLDFIVIFYFISFNIYIKRNNICLTKKRGLITEFDKQRIKALIRLLKKENIDSNDNFKIQLIIDLVSYEKDRVIPFHDFFRFIINPLIIIAIPCLTIFLEHLMFGEIITLQFRFLLLILTIIWIILATLCMFIMPMRWLIYGKYDRLITDLKLLQLIVPC